MPREPELKIIAEKIAVDHYVATSTLFNLVWSESRWDPNAEANGDRGLVQINRTYHPEVSDEEAFDPTYALTYAAEAIANGEEEQFTVCNCISYLKTRIKVPLMAEIVPNTVPKIGSVAIFSYKDKNTGRTVKHVALVEKLTATGFSVAESNFTHCLFDRRQIDWGDPHIVGFWSTS